MTIIVFVTDVWLFVTVTYDIMLNPNSKSKIENKLKENKVYSL